MCCEETVVGSKLPEDGVNKSRSALGQELTCGWRNVIFSAGQLTKRVSHVTYPLCSVINRTYAISRSNKTFYEVITINI